MNQKLTLSIDDSLVEFAHKYAKETGQSVSGLFEKYLGSLKASEENDEFSPATTELYGILAEEPLPYKKDLRREFHEKSLD